MLRRLLALVAVNLAVLLACLVVAELAFGTWFSRDPLDRLNLQRGVEVTVDARPLYPSGRVFAYRRDRWGFRGAGIDPAAVDVLTVGGSTTNQLYLPEDATWQAVLARELAGRGRPATIANAGIDGQSTVGHLYNFEGWFPHVPGLKPRVVLAYVGVNDAMLGGNSTDRLEFSSTTKWVRHNSALFRLGRTLQGVVEAKRGRLMHEPVDYAHAQWTATPNFAANRQARPDSDPAAYGRRLAEMVARIRAMGALPVLVTQARGDYRVGDGEVRGLAAAEGMNGVDHWRLLAEFNKVTLEVCRREGVPCLDLASEIRFDDGDFYDSVHNTPQGAEKIGRWLAAKLAGLA